MLQHLFKLIIIYQVFHAVEGWNSLNTSTLKENNSNEIYVKGGIKGDS